MEGKRYIYFIMDRRGKGRNKSDPSGYKEDMKQILHGPLIEAGPYTSAKGKEQYLSVENDKFDKLMEALSHYGEAAECTLAEIEKAQREKEMN